MQKQLLKKLICPYCHSGLRFSKRLGVDNYWFKCQCDTWPLIEGILYLKKDNRRKRATSLASFSFFSRIFFSLTWPLRALYRQIGFRNFVRVLEYLGYPRRWAKYLKNREKIPSFFISLLELDLIKNKKDVVVDIGCGSGNLFPYYYHYLPVQNLIGIDREFLTLYLARLFFAKKDTLLVCADVEKGIPLKSGAANRVFAADVLQGIENRILFLKEIRRILTNQGKGTVFHMLNKDTPTVPGLKGETPKVIRRQLKIAGFKNYCLISNEFIWRRINHGEGVPLVDDDELNRAYAYNIFFSKDGLPHVVSLKRKYFNLLKKTKINFYQDPKLVCARRKNG